MMDYLNYCLHANFDLFQHLPIVQNIKMKISHPRYLIPGNIDELNMDFPKYYENPETAVIKEAPAIVIPNTKSFLFSFPDVSIPVSLHETFTGHVL